LNISCSGNDNGGDGQSEVLGNVFCSSLCALGVLRGKNCFFVAALTG
jgi:hypothetical protein